MNSLFYQTMTPIVETFEDLGIAYYIGGSVASIAYGMPRSTMDVDIVAEIQLNHVQALITQFSPLGYIDARAMREALLHRSSFNIIPASGPAKIDVFVPKSRPFDKALFARVRYVELDASAPRPFALPSPEDIILLKLEWYEATNRMSIHQWPDVLGVLQSQENILDRIYLRHWATQLRLSELLEQAFLDAEV